MKTTNGYRDLPDTHSGRHAALHILITAPRSLEHAATDVEVAQGIEASMFQIQRKRGGVRR